MLIAYALAALIQTADSTDTLGPALKGQVQCYVPDAARKTCTSIAAYVPNGDGTYANTAIVLINKSPAVVLETVTPVKIVDGAVCGAIRAQDIAAGKLTVDGRVLNAAEASPILARVTTGLANVMDHQICTRYVPSGSDLIAKATMDGVAQPEQDQVVKWVSPADGYNVAP